MQNLGLVTVRAAVTFNRCEAEAQAGDRIPGDVAESGRFAAITPVYTGKASEVLTMGHSLLILLPIQH